MRSMTGYGNATVEHDGRELTIELKSVNHRFLDINIRYPRSLMFLEEDLRREIAKYLVRGHVEVNLNYRNTREDSKIVEVDTELAKQYAKAFDALAELGYEKNIRVSELSRMPDVLTVTQCDDDKDAILLLMRQAVEEACKKVIATRITEGEKIGADLKQKLDNILSFAMQIEQKSENNLAEYAERLKKRLEDILKDNQLDEQRVAQEVAIYADKIAIDEELVRLKTHISNMLGYMNTDEAVGRKLDFFIQELNREVNTIGSKSVNADIAKIVVSAKGEIEKLREQIQNIE